ncbi:MAG: diguanylate cyclase, partial [Nitrosomonadales bacterium]|nr:diguanylate cyclase [Nitrosomonadales bacterium]
KTRNEILEMLAKDAPLVNILQTIIHNVERENENMMCCILLVGDNGEQLLNGSVLSTSNDIFPASCTLELDIATNLSLYTIPSGKYLVVGDVQKHPSFTQYEIPAAKASLNSCWSRPIKGHSGKTLGAIAMYRKSARSQTTRDLQLIEHISNLAGIAIEQSRVNEELTQAMLVYQNSSDAMTVSDAEGIIINVNPAFTTLTGYSPEEILGRSHKVLSSGLQEREFYQAMWNCINTTGCWQGEILNRRKNGEIYTEWLTINSIFNEDGSVHRRVALFSDISMKKATEALIWKQANFDPLTELPNRSMFLDQLSHKIKIAHRNNLSLALLFIDLDHFKEVNDTLGHSVGDSLLKAAASRISSCVRET